VITRVSHMNIFVADQKKAYDVYVNKLGFKVHTDVTMDTGMRWLTITAPNDPNTEILLAEPNEPVIEKEAIPHFRAILAANAMPGGVLECDDCRKTYEMLKAKGIEFVKEPTKEFYGVEALFKDGCGNWFSLTEHAAVQR
jgi:catechol 2,3-dioxygenase-like lactoylglutathione lyase family enzyme